MFTRCIWMRTADAFSSDVDKKGQKMIPAENNLSEINRSG